MADNEQINVSVKIPGVVLPGWTVIVLSLCLVFSGTGFLLAYLQLKNVEREIRILQVITQDIENVLVRAGIAKRDDFIQRRDKGE